MTQRVVYPTLEVEMSLVRDDTLATWTLPSCCFHDLTSEDDFHLAGMGLTIIGNLVRILGQRLYDDALYAKLLLKRHAKDEGIECPWPGMPDDRPVPLDLTQMPFDVGMFATKDGDPATHRLNRLALMARIQKTWVPWLRQQMVVHA